MQIWPGLVDTGGLNKCPTMPISHKVFKSANLVGMKVNVRAGQFCPVPSEGSSQPRRWMRLASPALRSPERNPRPPFSHSRKERRTDRHLAPAHPL